MSPINSYRDTTSDTQIHNESNFHSDYQHNNLADIHSQGGHLKVSFSDQIRNLTKDIEENNHKSNNTMRLIHDKHNLKLRSHLGEKDSLIKDLQRIKIAMKSF